MGTYRLRRQRPQGTGESGWRSPSWALRAVGHAVEPRVRAVDRVVNAIGRRPCPLIGCRHVSVGALCGRGAQVVRAELHALNGLRNVREGLVELRSLRV